MQNFSINEPLTTTILLKWAPFPPPRQQYIAFSTMYANILYSMLKVSNIFLIYQSCLIYVLQKTNWIKLRSESVNITWKKAYSLCYFFHIFNAVIFFYRFFFKVRRCVPNYNHASKVQICYLKRFRWPGIDVILCNKTCETYANRQNVCSFLFGLKVWTYFFHYILMFVVALSQKCEKQIKSSLLALLLK